MERHRPRIGETAEVRKWPSPDPNQDCYCISVKIEHIYQPCGDHTWPNDKDTEFEGILIVYFVPVNNEEIPLWDGYRWFGPKLTEDQMQWILDLFEMDYRTN